MYAICMIFIWPVLGCKLLGFFINLKAFVNSKEIANQRPSPLFILYECKRLYFRDTDILKLRDHTGFEKDSTNRINAIHDDEEEDKSDSEKMPNPLEVRFPFFFHYSVQSVFLLRTGIHNPYLCARGQCHQHPSVIYYVAPYLCDR